MPRQYRCRNLSVSAPGVHGFRFSLCTTPLVNLVINSKTCIIHSLLYTALSSMWVYNRCITYYTPEEV